MQKDFNKLREQAAKIIPNEYELVTTINKRISQLEKKPEEGVPTKGTEVMMHIMQEIIDGKVTVSSKKPS